jgi:hypothetical protein
MNVSGDDPASGPRSGTRPGRPRHRIVLVREWDAGATGSGCCGRVGGSHHDLGSAEDFSRSRRVMHEVGEVYRRLRSDLGGSVPIEIVDPRNTAWIVPVVYRDARRRGMRRLDALREVNRATAQPAVIVDGRAIYSGSLGPPDEVVDAVHRELEIRVPDPG